MLNSNSNFTRLLLALPLVSALIQLSGCATIFTGTTDTLKFDANVPGVRLTIDGQYKGELPLTLTLSRNFINGGGEYLESLASALSGTRGGADSVITERALRNAPVLLEASGAHDFIHRFNDMLASHPSLRAYQM